MLRERAELEAAWRDGIYEVIQTMTASRSQGEIGIEHMCQLAGISRSGYYRHWQRSAPRRNSGGFIRPLPFLAYFALRSVLAELEAKIAELERRLDERRSLGKGFKFARDRADAGVPASRVGSVDPSPLPAAHRSGFPDRGPLRRDTVRVAGERRSGRRLVLGQLRFARTICAAVDVLLTGAGCRSWLRVLTQASEISNRAAN